MHRLQYYADGKLNTINLQLLSEVRARRTPRGARRQIELLTRYSCAEISSTLHAQRRRLTTRFASVDEPVVTITAQPAQGADVIPTESVVVDGANASDIKWAENEYGMERVQEGRHGKVLLQTPSDAVDRVRLAFRVARALYEQRGVDAAHPNFLRVVQRPTPSPRRAETQWALDNPGTPGLIGADVHALAAWTMTEGVRDVRVAVLDEGVDTPHPYLKAAVVAEADFVDDNEHAHPQGDDAHGTACAGIISSQVDDVKGLAPGAGLVAVRIAKSDDSGYWIFDDFDTADAIDWSWDEAGAHVLSNSWGGGPPVDVISGAFERARTRGRTGKGAVIVVAAGNEQAPVSYPGTLPGVLTVGASNQWDERKTTSSADGEDWWGSNYGEALDLLAPGVRITTTDIRGGRGYDRFLVTRSFNGTSSATPHVAAVAAMMLSVNPKLTEQRVREIINSTADPLSTGGEWNRFVGHGRLNAYAALRLARRG